MLIVLLAYLGGVLTIVSPCILPVLPFVFSRASGSFLRNGFPLLLGLILMFVAVASLASLAGGWAVQANAVGRWAALAILAIFGLTLLIPGLADRLTRPLVAVGGRLTESASGGGQGGFLSSLLLGVATGLLWAPCAGPILGLVLTGAALGGASVHTTLLLAAYAAGAATSLALALVVGGRVFAAMKKSLGAGEWVRRVLGGLVLAAVAAIALGVDTGFLTRVSAAGTTKLEQALIEKLHARPAAPARSVLVTQGDGTAASGGPAMSAAGAKPKGLPQLGPMPSFGGAAPWINSPPLTPDALRGKVVLVDFWTYSCINCLRALPYIQAWAKTYGPQGLVVIGIHTPEFAFEKNPANVQRAIKQFGLTYPVVMDNDYVLWKAYDNESWPAHYFIDAKGRIRKVHLGEGGYTDSEQAIRDLLAERNGAPVTGDLAGRSGSGVQAAANFDEAFSQETYLGYGRAAHLISPGGIRKDVVATYVAAKTYGPDDWSLIGRWTIAKEWAGNASAGAKIAYSFHARDLHMVLGPGSDGKPVRFRISLDGKPPGADHGLDTDAQGYGTITAQRLYQLVRQDKVAQKDRIFRIEFLDPGVQAYTFTFG
jgi:cytochrome c biogenesis protein CcdA/thiol-disulfide isomerase/thioredoxin